jgi:hypothetical protein
MSMSKTITQIGNLVAVHILLLALYTFLAYHLYLIIAQPRFLESHPSHTSIAAAATV